MIEHRNDLDKWIFDNVSHKSISIMDVDALVCFYNEPNKPLVVIEHKKQNEILRPTQWFNLPRLEQQHNLPYLIFRQLDDGNISVERIGSQYLSTIKCTVIDRVTLKRCLENFSTFMELYSLAV